MAPVAAPVSGPVIGGSTDLGDSPPPPPPVTSGGKSPGAGNLSGLILVLAVFAAVSAFVYGKLKKMQQKSSIHTRGLKMAAELKAAAQSNARARERPKKKGPPGSKGAAKFTPLQTEEDAPADGNAEDDGESEDDTQPTESAEENVAAPSGISFSSRCRRSMQTHSRGNGNEVKRRSLQDPEADEPDDHRARLRKGASDDDACSAASFGFGGELDMEADDDSAVEQQLSDPVGEPEGYYLGSDGSIDEEDDISPNDSVSNIGFSRPCAPPLGKGHDRLGALPSSRPSRLCTANGQNCRRHEARAPLTARRESGRSARGQVGAQMKTPDPDDPTFLTLGQLDHDNSALNRKQAKAANDDAFSMVHEAHLAMRQRIPGDEMRIDLSSKPAHLGIGNEYLIAQPTGVCLHDDVASDAGSDLTFLGGGGTDSNGGARRGGGQGSDRSHGRDGNHRTRIVKAGGHARDHDEHLDAPEGDDADLVAGEVATLHFDSATRRCSKSIPGSRPKPKIEPIDSSEREQRMWPPVPSGLYGKQNSKRPLNSSRGRPTGRQLEDAGNTDSGHRIMMVDSRRMGHMMEVPRDAKPSDSDKEHDDLLDEDQAADDDDAFTSVALSYQRRDPYLGARRQKTYEPYRELTGRAAGGGCVYPDGKLWVGSERNGRRAHPTHRVADTI